MNKKNRIIGLDILRIFSMFGIIGLHIINQGGLMENANIHSSSYYLILFILIICFFSVDIFGILSGYLNIKKTKNNNGRIVELIAIVCFYCILIPTIFYAFNLYNIRAYGIKEVISNFLPIIVGRYWYITCYLFLFFMMPYINKLCVLLDRKMYKKLLIVLFILLSVIPNVFFMTDFFRILDGYSPFWLIYCYFIGAYIKLYNIDLTKKKIILYIIFIFILEIFANSIIRNVGFLLFNKVVKGDWLINYISPFNLIISILLVIAFKKINLKNVIISNIIIYFSSISFSVYIIHCQKVIFDYILKDAFIFLLEYNSIYILFSIIIFITLIYILCGFIDEIRKLIFKFFQINKFIEYIGNKMNKFLD